MSFKEQLRDEILPKAVGYFNSGMGMNESVVKAAEEFGLNMDQTDRLVETMNTARTIAHYEKNAEDRTGTFQIADKDEVRRLIYGQAREKTASANGAHVVHDYSSYLEPERDFRHVRQTTDLFEKAAAENARDDTVEALGPSRTVEELTKRASQLSSMAGDMESYVGMARDEIETGLQKLASMLRGGYDPEARYAMFVASCSDRFPNVARSVERRMPASTVKEARASAAALQASSNVLDTSSIEDEISLSEDMEDCIRKVASASEKARRVRDAECEVRGVLRKLAQHVGDGSSWSGGGHGGGNGGNDYDRKKKKDDGKGKGNDRKKDNSAGGGYADTLFSYMYGGGMSPKVLDSFLTRKYEDSRDIGRYVDNIRRSAILEDLYTNDPILSDADPNAVANAYRTLVQTSPSMSLNKEIVRAVLRQSVNSVAVSPFDAKQWADFENVVKRTEEAETAMDRRMKEGRNA